MTIAYRHVCAVLQHGHTLAQFVDFLAQLFDFSHLLSFNFRHTPPRTRADVVRVTTERADDHANSPPAFR
jgi:hypothetical protein